MFISELLPAPNSKRSLFKFLLESEKFTHRKVP